MASVLMAVYGHYDVADRTFAVVASALNEAFSGLFLSF